MPRAGKNNPVGTSSLGDELTANPLTWEPSYTDEERVFLMALDGYRTANHRPFLTLREILRIAVSLGYRKVAKRIALPVFHFGPNAGMQRKEKRKYKMATTAAQVKNDLTLYGALISGFASSFWMNFPPFSYVKNRLVNLGVLLSGIASHDELDQAIADEINDGQIVLPHPEAVHDPAHLVALQTPAPADLEKLKEVIG